MSTITSYTDRVPQPTGWSTYELELFGRAAELLCSCRGFCVETDYGLTDEGEPWLVLCDADSGDVFGHFARLDDGYIACIPFHDGTLTGGDLRDLLGRFLRRHGITWSTVGRPIVRNADRLAALGLVVLHCAA